MVFLSDGFESLADGQALSVDADWVVWNASGSGVPTMDQHDAHSDLSQVVDMSNVGDAYCLFQTQVGSADHYVECAVFVDKGFNHLNFGGPIARGSTSTPGTALDGYAAFAYSTGNGSASSFYIGIYRLDDGVPTQLATTGNMAGETTGLYDFDIQHTVRLEVVGTALTAFVDGVEELSTTDSTYSTGQWAGFRLFRQTSAVSSQPFVDNWTADTLAGGATPVQADLVSSWDVDGPVQSDLAASWDVSAAVTSDLVASWDVGVSAQADLGATWDVSASVQADLGVSWDIFEPVQADLGATWDVDGSAQADLPVSWNVEQAGAVQADLSATWDTLTTVQADLASTWQVLTSTLSDASVSWDVTATVQADVSISWDVLQTGAVQADLAASWNVAGAVTADAVTVWDTLAAVSADTSATWETLAVLESDLAAAWDVAAEVEAFLAATWDVVSLIPNGTAVEGPTYVVLIDSPTTVTLIDSPTTVTLIDSPTTVELL